MTRTTRHRIALTCGVLGVLLLGAAAIPMVEGGSATSKLSPPVPDEQLDLAQYVGQPCGLLQSDRAVRRHLTIPGQLEHDGIGTTCRWNSTDTQHPNITVQADAQHGLEPTYRQRGGFGSFQPTAISHYPAALTTDTGRVPADGACSTRVGVGDNDLLVVTADYRGVRSAPSSDPCLDSNTVAFEIIQQLRSGNP